MRQPSHVGYMRERHSTKYSLLITASSIRRHAEYVAPLACCCGSWGKKVFFLVVKISFACMCQMPDGICVPRGDCVSIFIFLVSENHHGASLPLSFSLVL